MSVVNSDRALRWGIGMCAAGLLVGIGAGIWYAAFDLSDRGVLATAIIACLLGLPGFWLVNVAMLTKDFDP